MSLRVHESGHNVSLPSMNPTLNTLWDGRHVIIATNSFLGNFADFFHNLVTSIGTFFVHRHADFHMFWNSFGSMCTTSTAQADIDRRVQQLGTFAGAVSRYVYNYEVANAGVGGLPGQDDTLTNAFQALSQDTKDLFYYVNGRNIGRLIFLPTRQKNEIEYEIIRECNAAIFFQQNLTFINKIFHWCAGSSNSSPAVTATATGTTTTATQTGTGTQPIPIPPPGPVSFPIVPQRVNGVIVNIPGTVPYVRGNIPALVQQKADEIDRLRQQFDALPQPRPAVPDVFKDGISYQDFMLIPVFDASHPEVQRGMIAACRPGATAADADIAPLNNRNNRHIYDAESLEQAYQAQGPYGGRLPARCPACRHPEPPDQPGIFQPRVEVDRANLRIDTELQDQILVFLRNTLQSGT